MGIFGRKNEDTPTVTTEARAELAALTGEYTIDPMHSKLGFTVRHAMVTNVNGSFPGFEGSLHLDGSDPTASTAALDVQVASVNTGVTDRDGHLKSADFFDVEKFPQMTFRSTKAESLGGDDYRITGDLTIKDVTKAVSIDLEFHGAAKDPAGNERVGFEGKTEILRSDWGLSWNTALETGGFMLSDKIKLNLDISAIRKTEA